jgi:hypothetical protein
MVTLERPGGLSVQVKMALSNYSRNLESVQRTVVVGREFVVSKASLDEVSFPKIRRGDRIVSSSFGDNTVADIVEMVDMGSNVIGFRIRTA